MNEAIKKEVIEAALTGYEPDECIAMAAKRFNVTEAVVRDIVSA